MSNNHNSIFSNIALAVASSAITAALIFLTSANSESVNEEDDDDDFASHQGKPKSEEQHVPFIHQRLTTAQIRRRSQKLLKVSQKRRTLRFFSSDPVPKDVIETILKTSCTAPSGAHKQPWTFVAVSNQHLKQKIRELVEHEETINYQSRMRKSWVEDLKPIMNQLHSKSDAKIEKPYLSEAPWIIAVFKQTHGGIDPDTGKRVDHYYVNESVGLACGMLCMAITNANLVTLTSTPMGSEKAIRELLDRPDNEKLFLLLPVGFPAKDATVPYRDPERKASSETIVWKY